MTLYYFSLRDDRGLFADENGIDLRDETAAQEEAARVLSDKARDAVYSFKGANDYKMSVEVRDDDGPVMNASLTFELCKSRD